MIVVISIVSFLILTFIFGKIHLLLLFRKEVKELFSHSENISNNIFTYGQLAGLPDPVQRYFKLVLQEGQPYISYARMTHDGQFKTGLDKDWINIKGEQYATTQVPGFIWKGTTKMFIARDMYISGKGRLAVSLFGLLTILDKKGSSYNQGELTRWLGESVLYPTNLLPNEKLQWQSIDAQTARLTFMYKEMLLAYIVRFNETGEIIQLETERYMEKTTMETWVIKLSNYKHINKIITATSFEVLWRLKRGDFSYAKFNIRKIEYNNPRLF